VVRSFTANDDYKLDDFQTTSTCRVDRIESPVVSRLLSWLWARPLHGNRQPLNSRMNLKTLIFTIFGILAVAKSVHAASPARLIYARGLDAEKCPPESELRKSVTERIGYDPFYLVAKTTVIVQLGGASKGFRAYVQFVDENGFVIGERNIVSKDRNCAEMIRATALDISIALDEITPPAPVLPTVESEPVVSPPSPVIPSSAPPASVPPPSAPTRSHEVAIAKKRTVLPKIRIHIGAGALSSFNSAPSLAFGGYAFLTWRWKSFGLGVEERFDLPASSALSGGGEVRSSLIVQSLVGCFYLSTPFVCAVGSVGSFHGGTDGLSSTNGGTVPFVSSGARIGFELPIEGGFFLRTHVDVAYVFTPNRIEVDRRDAFVVPRITAAFGIAGSVHF